MARIDCKLERNVRIYRAYLLNVKIASIARFENISPNRVSQIIAFTKQRIDEGDFDYVQEFIKE